MRWSGVIVALTGALAHAQPAYPIEVVDRPLVMLDGMNELSLYYSRGHALVTTADTMGNPVSMRSDFGERTFWSFDYAHSFGRLELNAGLTNDDGDIGVRFAARPDLVVSFFLDGHAGYYDTGELTYGLGESLRAAYRLVHLPQRFVLDVTGGVRADQFQARIFDGSIPDGVETSTDIGVSATAQITPQLSAVLGSSVGALVYSSLDTERDVRLSATSALVFSLYHWDFSVTAGGFDLTDTRRLFVGGQIAFRWGMAANRSASVREERTSAESNRRARR